jgi:hypothetical protein
MAIERVIRPKAPRQMPRRNENEERLREPPVQQAFQLRFERGGTLGEAGLQMADGFANRIVIRRTPGSGTAWIPDPGIAVSGMTKAQASAPLVPVLASERRTASVSADGCSPSTTDSNSRHRRYACSASDNRPTSRQHTIKLR